MEGGGFWKKLQAHAISCLAALMAGKEPEIKKGIGK